MERQRRASNDADKENDMWRNPCEYADGSNTKSTRDFSTDDVKKIAIQARHALSTAEEYQNKVANALDGDNFDKVQPRHETTLWLRSDTFKAFMTDVVLPDNKSRQAMSQEFLNDVVSKIDDLLPKMQKDLKMVLAGLYQVTENGLNNNYSKEVAIQSDFKSIMSRVKQVLCDFNIVMEMRQIKSEPLWDEEIPDPRVGDRVANVFAIYRDTMLYLEYLAQVMDAWAAQG